VEIEINFYGPCHGHNVQDAHFGAGKILLRSEAKNGPITSKGQILEAFMRLRSKKEEARNKKGLDLRKTGDFVVVVQEVEVKENEEKVKRIKGQIRKWFSWKMEEGRRKLSGAGEWKENPIELEEVVEEIDEQEEEERRKQKQNRRNWKGEQKRSRTSREEGEQAEKKEKNKQRRRRRN